MRSKVWTTWFLLLAACGQSTGPAVESDFAVLARSAPGFAQARPETRLHFPRDHGAHPGYRIEWWYLTANLNDAAGRQFGVQWTLFRTATRPPAEAASANPWQDPQVFMAHFAITTPTDHVAFQRYARAGEHGGLSQAGVETEPFMAWLDDWSLQSAGPGWLPLELQARQGRYSVQLELTSDQAPVPQGNEGFSLKHSDGGGSHYYNQPYLAAGGQVTFDGETVAVQGDAWLDHEWSSQFLQSDQAGWDWFALHLESGEKLMLFRLRSVSGRPEEDFLYAVLMREDAPRRLLDPAKIRLSVLGRDRVSGRDLPLRWRIELPEIGREMEIRPLHTKQWLDVDFPYWEGVVLVWGESPGTRGRGYLELTGYPGGR